MKKDKVKITKVQVGVADGSKTYGAMCKPKYSSKSRAHSLSELASSRIVALMGRGSQADSLARKHEPITDEKQLNDLEFRNGLAEQPKIVQFAYWRSHLDELRRDLGKFRTESGKKSLLMIPVIESQIEQVETTMRELFDLITKERRVISRSTSNKK